jgi:threonine synthase
MDVGAPSNFERMAAHWNYEELRQMIRGVSVTDDLTRKAIAEVYQNYRYYLDPHSAVGWAAVQQLRNAGDAASLQSPLAIPPGITAVLATAHPAKFADIVESITGAVPVPASIQKAMDRTVRSTVLPMDQGALRDFLLSNP